MKKNYIALCYLFMTFQVLAESISGIVITSIETKDWTFEKNRELFFGVHKAKNQIEYCIQPATSSFRTRKYLVENYSSVWDGDTTTKEKLVSRYKHWKNNISEEFITSFFLNATSTQHHVSSFQTMHTSHHYLTIEVEIIMALDTIQLTKSKPFDSQTPWLTNKFPGTVLNFLIDEAIYSLIPTKFLGREDLLNGLNESQPKVP